MSDLSVQGISRRFGGLQAVSDVTLKVPSGSIVGLIGPNGAGKTTVVNLITGLLRLNAGKILFEDNDLSELGMAKVARAGISRTFQNVRLLPGTTVADNILIGYHRHLQTSFAANLFGLPSARKEVRALRSRAKTLLTKFGLDRYADYPASSLAYGHQRRVEIMRALATSPKILILDEPVAGMNDVEAEELGVIFREIAASGIGVLLIEHNMRFVTSLCSNIYVLDAGKIIAEGAAERVMNDAAVISAYLGA